MKVWNKGKLALAPVYSIICLTIWRKLPSKPLIDIKCLEAGAMSKYIWGRCNAVQGGKTCKFYSEIVYICMSYLDSIEVSKQKRTCFLLITSLSQRIVTHRFTSLKACMTTPCL